MTDTKTQTTLTVPEEQITRIVVTRQKQYWDGVRWSNYSSNDKITVEIKDAKN